MQVAQVTMLLQVSLFVILLAFSGGTPYYITPSDNVIAGNNTCFFEGRPLQPCSTLETLAANYKLISSDDFGENITLLFLPGNYVVQNMTHLDFTSFQVISLSPNETDSVISLKCNAEMIITFSNVSIMNMKSLEFISCGGKRTKGDVIKFVSSNNMTVQILDSSFIGTENGSSMAFGLIYSNFYNRRYYSTITINNCNFTANMQPDYNGGAISLTSSISSKVIVHVLNTTFQNNSGGAIYARNTVLYLHDSSVFSYNTAVYGSAILAINTVIYLNDSSVFSYNTAVYGGAIYAISTTIFLQKYLNFISNNASLSGGAIMARKSRIYFQGNVTFENNSAGRNGGAIFLSRSYIYILERGETSFIKNRALLQGGALYAEDSIENCNNDTGRFNLLQFSRSDWKLFFTDNAAFEGSILYGSNWLSNCSYDYLKRFGISSAIASDAVNICFCNEGEADCTLRQKKISAYRGELISFNVTTLTQCRNFTPSVISICEDSTLAVEKCYQNIHKNCKGVTFNVYSKQVSRVILKAEGPCKEINKLTVSISFKPCPSGFQLSISEDRCECDKRLRSPELKSVLQCEENHLTIQKKEKSFWFQLTNDALQVCEICPLGYCKELLIVAVNDTQCADNRTGIICGQCQDSFSVALGNFRCIKCSNTHKFAFLWLIPLFAVMGLILVLAILLLDITVSIGLINGLIFYANILSISGLTNNYNCSIHTLLSVFISWVNLDFGIKTCFYSGMDMYQKTWLQFAFPLYIWLLVGLIIILSHYSTRVMRLLGRKVIPVLATLFLLSYIKILRIVITVFTFSKVLKGDADNTTAELIPRKVWTYDGNVDYLSGKHIPLFIVALLFLVVLFLPYTFLLTFGQCLRSLPRRKGLRWLHSTAFISIMDAYHAPLNRKHRYCTGLLLWIRCNLLIAFIPSYKINSLISNTFATAIVTIILLVFKASIKNGIYRSSLANIFENIFLLNLGLLASTVYYLEGVNSPKREVCYCLTASISVALVTFLAIIACHIYFKMKGYNALKRFIHKITAARKVKATKKTQPEDTPTFTTTTVELREALLETFEDEISQHTIF